MMKICDRHGECLVVWDNIGTCPVCKKINKLEEEITEVERCLDEYEEKGAVK